MTEAEKAKEQILADWSNGKICNVGVAHYLEVVDMKAGADPSLPSDVLYSGDHLPSGGMSFGHSDPVERRINNENRF